MIPNANRLAASAALPPADGNTTFFFLTFDGIRSYGAPEVELGEERDTPDGRRFGIASGGVFFPMADAAEIEGLT